MIKKYLKIYIPILVLIFTFSVLSVSAATCDPKTNYTGVSGVCCSFSTHLDQNKTIPTRCYVPYIPLDSGAFNELEVKANGNLGVFLGQAFNYVIAIAVVLALIMIIFGGIQYMTTDSWNKKDEGKTRIKDALTGLGLALISWLILYTINPNLVDFKGNTLLSGDVNNINHQIITNYYV